MKLDAAQLAVLSALVEARTGQQLPAGRSWRAETALRTLMRADGIADSRTVMARLVRPGEERFAARVVEALLNNETSFFRDAAAFDLLATETLERLRRQHAARRRLRIWSAACSTGQEAYSLAMMLRDDAPRWAGWTFDIVATDISESVVAAARAGRFSRFEIQRGLPVRTMLRWFREDGDHWVADPTLRRDIRFAVHDLRRPPPGRFDIILCRNALMYFPLATRVTVFDQLAAALDPGGILMLGAGETVIGQTARFQPHPDLRGLYASVEPCASPRRAAAR